MNVINNTSVLMFSSTNPSLIASNIKPASLYDIFANSGPSFVLITFVGLRFLISAIGTVFNLLLFWITITDK